MATTDVRLTGDQEVKGSIPAGVQQYYFIDIDKEILSMVILSLPLIQKKHLLFLAKECAQILVNCLED